jgi:hypothetical protein
LKTPPICTTLISQLNGAASLRPRRSPTMPTGG